MLQLSLLASGPTVEVDRAAPAVPRLDLANGAWVDLVRTWVLGADTLYEQVEQAAPWGSHRRVMWDKVVDEPRLSTRHWAHPPEVVRQMSSSLSERYGLALPSISANWYRDGRDSVAWHGDTSGRHCDTTVVAIVSLGAPRRFLVRPRGGGPSKTMVVGHGDLLVMGGTCQRTYEHAIPKTANAGPRISLMFREPGVF